MAEIDAGTAFVKLTVQDKLTSGLLAAKAKLEAFGASAMRIGSVLGGLSGLIIAPLSVAVGGLIAGGKMDRLLSLWQSFSSSIQAAGEQLATAVAPVLGDGLTIMSGIARVAERWLKTNSAAVTILARVGVTLGAIGAASMALGAASNSLASGFGLLARLVPLVAAFLASPLGIVVAIGAAIGGGVAAWMRFTASGQAAARMLLATFAPIIKFVQTVLGGLGDAIAAGNLVLAGRIAVKTLQIIFAEGVNTIADLIGGTLGHAIGDIGRLIVSGNFTGAWQTAVAGMAKLWAGFAQGVVTVFSAAAKAVTEAWAKTVSGIANGLLRASAQGGVIGRIASLIVGADVGQLQAENDRLDRARGIRQDIFGVGSASISDSTSAISGPVKNFLDAMHKASTDIATDASENLGSRLGRGSHRVDIAGLNADLERLRKEAARQRAAVTVPALPTPTETHGVAVGFSGAALAAQLQGGGGSTQGRIAKATEDSAKLLGKQIGILDAIKQRIKVFAITA